LTGTSSQTTFRFGAACFSYLVPDSYPYWIPRPYIPISRRCATASSAKISGIIYCWTCSSNWWSSEVTPPGSHLSLTCYYIVYARDNFAIVLSVSFLFPETMSIIGRIRDLYHVQNSFDAPASPKSAEKSIVARSPDLNDPKDFPDQNE